jgi:hypothetical protein
MSETDLKGLLDSARPGLEKGLAAALGELEKLDARRAELVALIAQARAALGLVGLPTNSGTGARGLTLHEALAQVLGEQENEWMTARELADEVNKQGLYSKRDGSPVEANQVHARTKNYSNLFEKNGSRIRLRNR